MKKYLLKICGLCRLRIDTFKTICLEKGDRNRYFALALKTTINIHTKCNTTFRRRSSIVTNKKNQNTVSDAKKQNEVVNALNFDFNSLCFICGKDASDTFRKLQEKTKAKIK